MKLVGQNKHDTPPAHRLHRRTGAAALTQHMANCLTPWLYQAACGQHLLTTLLRGCSLSGPSSAGNDQLSSYTAQRKCDAVLSLNHVLSCVMMSSSAAGKLALERHQHGAPPKKEACAPGGPLPSAHNPPRVSPPCKQQEG